MLTNNFRGILWKIKTAVQKRWFLLENRLGLHLYSRWIRENEPRLEEHKDSEKPLAGNQPTFSVIIIVNEPITKLVDQTVQSLTAQTIPDWRACVIISSLVAIQPEKLDLDRITVREPRLSREIIESAQNQSQAIKSAIQSLGGDAILVLASGDTISPFTFSMLQTQWNDSTEDNVLYTDEDHLQEHTLQRCNPILKPDWSPELLLSTNYLQRAFFQRQLVEDVLEESRDFQDLVYRCIELSQCIQHVPAILIHQSHNPALDWFPNEVSTQHIEAHLIRTGIRGVRGARKHAGSVQVVWDIEKKPVSIIIPTKDNSKILRRCIEAILRLTDYPEYEIVLVDNGSVQKSTSLFYKDICGDKRIRIIDYPGEFNFSTSLNLGAQHAKNNLFVFLNNDTQVTHSGWLTELAGWAYAYPEIGIVGALLYFPDGIIQHAGVVIGLEGHASHIFAGSGPDIQTPFGPPNWYRNYMAVTAAAMTIRREVFDQLGGFDTSYELVFSDVDICIRAIRAGYRILTTPFAPLIHYEGKTRANYIPRKDMDLAYERFKDIVIKGDPYFNPNLSYSVRLPILKHKNEELPITRLEKILKFN